MIKNIWKIWDDEEHVISKIKEKKMDEEKKNQKEVGEKFGFFNFQTKRLLFGK